MSKRSRYVVVACMIGGCTPEVEPEMTHNPPMPEPPQVVVGAITEVANDGKLPPNTALNASAAGQGMVFRAGAGGCSVFPSDGVQRPPGAMPPAVSLPCPPTMTDPVWEACPGTLVTTHDPAVCTCRISGNPPPPSKDMACPAHG